MKVDHKKIQMIWFYDLLGKFSLLFSAKNKPSHPKELHFSWSQCPKTTYSGVNTRNESLFRLPERNIHYLLNLLFNDMWNKYYLWRIWMILNRLYVSLNYPLDHLGSIRYQNLQRSPISHIINRLSVLPYL